MPSTNPIALKAGLFTAEPASFIPTEGLQSAIGLRYAPDSSVAHRPRLRTAFNTAAPDAGVSSIIALDFNAAADQIVMFQGTHAYSAVVGATGSFAAINEQTADETLTPAPFVVLEQAIPIVTAKFGDSFLVADGLSRPTIIENNIRIRSLGLAQPSWTATFSDPGQGASFTAQSIVSYKFVSNFADSIDGDVDTYAAVIGSISRIVFDPTLPNQIGLGYAIVVDYGILTVGWTSTSAKAWSVSVDLSGTTTSGPPSNWDYRIETSTDYGVTFSQKKSGSTITGRETFISSFGTTLTAASIQVKVTVFPNYKLPGLSAGNINIFQVALLEPGASGAAVVVNTLGSGIRYAFTEIRQYERILTGETEPISLEVESSLSPLSPIEDVPALSLVNAFGNTVTRGTIQNTEATHWRVYRSTDGASNDATKALDQFSKIATIDVSETTFTDLFSEAGHPLDYQNPLESPPIIIVGDIIFDANSPPPSGCDVVGSYQGSAVYASLLSPGRFWWSRPLFPDAVPSIYSDLINGTVTAFADVGVLLVFTTQAITAYGVLPLASDTEFFPSREKREVSKTRGCVSRRGVALFQPRGSEVLAAFIAHDGVYMTNGAQVELLSSALDWPALIPAASLPDTALIDDPKERCLRLFYDDAAGLRQQVPYYYGEKAWGGPQRYPSGSVAGILQGVGVYQLFSEQNGIVYVEDSGITDAASIDTGFSVKTAQLYPFGTREQGKVERVLIHTPAASDVTATVAVETRVDGRKSVTTTKVIDLSKDGWKAVDIRSDGRACQSLNIAISSASTLFPGVSRIAFDTDIATNMGAAQPGV